MRFFNLKSLLSLFLLIVALWPSVKAELMNGTWLRHPSFYKQIHQIIDGESKTYFLLRQQNFSSLYQDTNFNTTFLFVFDKENPSLGIQPLNDFFPFLSTEISCATYSSEYNSLYAAADDGSLWIVPDQGEPVFIIIADNAAFPGRPHFNSIIESPIDGQIWVAATYGYFTVDPVSHKIVNSVETDFPVDWIAPFGDTLVIFSDNSAYISSLSSLPRKKAMLTPLKATGKGVDHLIKEGCLISPSSLMPLTLYSFAFLGPHPSQDNANTIAVASRSGDNWNIISLKEDEIRKHSESESHNLPAINNAYSNKDGYYIQSQNKVYEIIRGIDPEINGDNSNFISKIIKEIDKTSDSRRESASWNFVDFWFFSENEGFYRKTNKNGAWDGDENKIWPAAPAPFIASQIVWHDTYGLLVSNHGQNISFEQTVPNTPWLVSAFSNGKWSQLSPVFHPSEEILNNDNWKNIFKANIERFPIAHPDGFAVDPNNPKYAYAGSMYDGMARINLENPSETPLHISNSISIFSGFPGFLNIMPENQSWRYLIDFSAPKFDAEGRLWALYWNHTADFLDLCFYTPEQLAANDFNRIGHLQIPIKENMTKNQDLLPLKHPANKNIIISHNGGYSSTIFIIDHNGTPENPSDDRLTILDNLFESESRYPVGKGYIYSLWEDPATGLLWVSNLSGTFTVDPSLALENSDNAVSRIWVKSGSQNNKDSKLLETSTVNAYAVDNQNRLWIGTNNRGLLCLSPERDRIIADLNTSNSAIPSDKVFALGFNPQRNSIMISTEKGLAEFFPAGSIYDTMGINVSPRHITPTYGGWITFSGLNDSLIYEVRDSRGIIVASIGKPSGGILQWDITDSDGKRPSTGVYEVHEKGGENPLASFSILK